MSSNLALTIIPQSQMSHLSNDRHFIWPYKFPCLLNAAGTRPINSYDTKSVWVKGLFPVLSSGSARLSRCLSLALLQRFFPPEQILCIINIMNLLLSYKISLWLQLIGGKIKNSTLGLFITLKLRKFAKLGHFLAHLDTIPGLIPNILMLYNHQSLSLYIDFTYFFANLMMYCNYGSMHFLKLRHLIWVKCHLVTS